MTHQPKRPIPEPLRGLDPDSFAHYTVMERLPDIAGRVIPENNFSQPIVRRLETLVEEIPFGSIRHLKDAKAPDAAAWADFVVPYLDQNWLQIPWFVAETYLFRRILEATGYFEPGEGYQVDPYGYQKRKGLESGLEAIAGMSRHLEPRDLAPTERDEGLAALLAIDLWGNQADLSLWSADRPDEQPRHTDTQTAEQHILVNDTDAVIACLTAQGDKPVRLDVIVDNAGVELVGDLGLTDFCLSHDLAAEVRFHLKSHPTFVSDATIVDVEQTIHFLAEQPQPEISAFGQRLQTHLEAGRWRLTDDFFWTSPLSMWEMPERVRQILASSDLLISKGDANYRRLLGDRHWPYTTPFAEVVTYLPAPLVALRTCKSEVIVGLEPKQIERLEAQEADWITNGHWGVIQLSRFSIEPAS